ncbi:DUF4176 domain-containing protein [Limosilactobacillus fermentum]
MTKVNLLPMGSLVYLKGGDMKLMIIARGPVFEDDHGETVYADYLGVPYPGGFQPDEGAFFNQDAVDRLIFRGYEDEEEERYKEIYAEWEADLDIKKAKTPE